MGLISIRMPDELEDAIRGASESSGQTITDVVVEALKCHLSAPGKMPAKTKAKAPEWLDSAIEAFWQAYPKKTSKKPALTALKRMILKKPDVEFWRSVIRDAGTRYANTEKKFIPNPTTYLNQERWEDEAPHENTRPATQSRIDRTREQTRALFAAASASEAGSGDVGADDSAIRAQVDFDRG